VACVVGFPEGTHDTQDKVKEAREAVEQGARELDMVINYPKLKNGEYTAVYDDILAVRTVAPAPVLLKTIIEASELDKDEIIAATIIACMAGVDFV
jgi:deoxyribose-phosphate aldolase